MVGRKCNFTPYSRNWMVTAPILEPPCTTGTGNSPPDMKLAGLPFIARTFGSARICSRFLASSASMVAPKFRSGRYTKRFSALVNVVVTGLPGDGTVIKGGEYCWVVTPPIVLVAPLLNKLKPR